MEWLASATVRDHAQRKAAAQEQELDLVVHELLGTTELVRVEEHGRIARLREALRAAQSCGAEEAAAAKQNLGCLGSSAA